jgi:hypothetical protein
MANLNIIIATASQTQLAGRGICRLRSREHEQLYTFIVLVHYAAHIGGLIIILAASLPIERAPLAKFGAKLFRRISGCVKVSAILAAP